MKDTEMKKVLLSDELDDYIKLYKKVSGRNCKCLSISESENRLILMLIAEHQAQSPTDETVYYETNVDDSDAIILVWRNVDIVVSDEGAMIRKQFVKENKK